MAGMCDDLKNVTEWLLVHARRKFCDTLAIVPEKHRDAQLLANIAIAKIRGSTG